MIEDKEELNEQIQDEAQEEKPEKKKWNKLRDPEDMGAYICELRELHNMTQNNLATQLFLTRKAVSKWETGRGYPSLDVIPKIAEVLSTTLDELLTGKTEPVDYIMRNNKAINLMNQFVRNRKVKITVISTFLFLFTLLIMYFVANFNATQIYSIYTYNEAIHVENTILVKTQSKEYLNIGNIYTDFKDIDENTEVEYTIYIGSEDNIDTIIHKFSSFQGIPHMKNSNFQEIPKMHINDKANNLYLKIEYKIDKEKFEYITQLVVDLQYKSNDIFKSHAKSIPPILANKQGDKTNQKEEIIEQGIDITFLFNKKILNKIDGAKIEYDSNFYEIKMKEKIINILSNEEIYKINLDTNTIVFKSNGYNETYQIIDGIIDFTFSKTLHYKKLEKIINIIKGSYEE